MVFQYEQVVPFTFADEHAHLTPGGCIDLFQDAANLHTRAVVSPAYLASSTKVWILNAWHILFQKPCHYNDQVTISTWSAGTKGMFALRYYTIADGHGNAYVKALSHWFLYDRATQAPARITQEDTQWYEPSPPLALGEAKRKLILPSEMEPLEPVHIWRYMIDGNGHLNNSWYVKIAGEFLPPDRPLRALRVEYRSAAHYGDVLYPAVARAEDQVWIALNDRHGKLYAGIEATF